MNFSELDLRWKVMVIIGLIALLIVVFLVVFIVLVLKTDLISYIGLENGTPDISEFDYIFEDVKSEESKESLESLENFEVEDFEAEAEKEISNKQKT